MLLSVAASLSETAPERAHQLFFPRSCAHFRAAVRHAEEMLRIVFQQKLLGQHEIGDRHERFDVAAVSGARLETQHVERRARKNAEDAATVHLHREAAMLLQLALLTGIEHSA